MPLPPSIPAPLPKGEFSAELLNTLRVTTTNMPKEKKVVLIAARFQKVGSGISDHCFEVGNSLEKFTDYNIEKRIQPNAYLKLNPKLRKGFTNTVNNWLYFNFGFDRKDVTNKNVHVLSLGDMPPKFFGLPRKKIVTVHDAVVLLSPVALEGIKNIVYLKTVKRRFFESYLRLKEFDKIIAVSDIVSNVLEGLCGIEPEKLRVINNPINLDKFHNNAKRKGTDKTIIGYINTFGQNKLPKLEKFIQIFKQVKDDDLELRIYGANFPRLDLISDDKRIKYYGFLDESLIAKTYNLFDVYLQTSSIEPFGIPPMKAKACRVPVLCYDGILPDIVKRNTILWRENTLPDILKSRAWRKINLNKAYSDAVKCSVPSVMEKMENVYDEVFYNKK